MAFLAAVPEIVEAVGAEGAAAGAGAEAAGAEGEAAAGEESDLDLGGEQGHKHGSLKLSQEQFQQLAHSQAVVAAITDRAQKCCDIANELAITKDAKYEVRVTNTGTRARAKVTAANFKGVVDDAYHSTLLKAAAQTGSDPRIPDTGGEGEEEGPEGGGEEGAAAAEGEAGEVESIAEHL